MPAAYRKGARDLHDDWPCWPLTLIPRRLTTFLLPLPAKLVSGDVSPRWMAWQEGYPESPGAEFRQVQPGTAAWDLKTRFGKTIEREVLAYDPVPPAGQSAVFAVWLDNAWRECFYTVTKSILGRRIHHNRGLKFDMTHGDFMWNFPEASLTMRAA